MDMQYFIIAVGSVPNEQ